MFKRASNFFRKTVRRSPRIAHTFDRCPRFPATHVKPPGVRGTQFVANPGHFGVTWPLAPHDLGRARTPAESIRPRHTGTGADGAHLAPRRRAERNGHGRRLRVRLDGPGRRRDHRGGRGGRRGGRRRRTHRPVSGPDPCPCPCPDPALPSDAHADPAGSRAPSAAEARADTEAGPTASAHPRTEARASTASASAPTAASTGAEAEARAAPARSGRGTETHAEARTDTERAPRSGSGSGQLSGVPHPAAQARAPRRSVTGLVHPAHHRARGARRRRAAPALTPGGTPCRIGLFSPSRWRPRAWWSSS